MEGSSKSERSIEDKSSPLGMGALDVLGRLSASMMKMGESDVEFKSSLDVRFGGVLLAVPALLANGLLSHTDKYFKLPSGYYRMDSIFLLLGLMALGRIKSIEQLRYESPGEWGKILGLDRIPEVRTLREKISVLTVNKDTESWSAQLCSDWMELDPESASILYVDGHVRVYHGSQTNLPRHYVARQKLCLRATTDYWVNAMDGQPFFLINKEVDPGLLKVMENEIVPRLEKDVPGQYTSEQLQANPLLHRFTLIFDREGYSPGFMLRMRNRRIACLTYNKYPGEDWPEKEFVSQDVKIVSGNVVKMELAERAIFVSEKVLVREIRKRSERGHQTSILSTDYRSEAKVLAAAMFARWSQENFFKYMREHYCLDSLVDYSIEAIPDTERVVNPEYRRLDSLIRSKVATMNRRLAEFGSISLLGGIEKGKVEAYQEKKAKLAEQIEEMKKDVEKSKEEIKKLSRHITIAQLPEQERFSRLSNQSKHFIDTIKMIAYRAETAMANILRELMSRCDDRRSLLRAIYRSDADIIPDKKEGILTVRIHHLANLCEDHLLSHLCQELTQTETVFPGTNLRMIFKLVS